MQHQHRNYRFYQPNDNDGSHDPQISLPLSLGHDKELELESRESSIVKTPSPGGCGVKVDRYGVNISGKGGSRSSEEEEMGLWRQNSGASLGSSKLSKLSKLEEDLEEEGMRYARQEQERARSRRDRKKEREARADGIMRSTEVSATR